MSQINYLECDACREDMELTDPHVRFEPGEVNPDSEALTFHIPCFRQHCRVFLDEHEETCIEVVNGGYLNSPLVYRIGYYQS